MKNKPNCPHCKHTEFEDVEYSHKTLRPGNNKIYLTYYLLCCSNCGAVLGQLNLMNCDENPA